MTAALARLDALPDLEVQNGEGGLYEAPAGPLEDPAFAARAQAALDLAGTVQDPQPRWWRTDITLPGSSQLPVALVAPGQTLGLQVRKFDLTGERYAGVKSSEMSVKVGWQGLDGAIQDNAAPAVWKDEGLLEVTVPADRGPGRLLVALRPINDDPAVKALTERWSAVFSAEIWALAPGVVDLAKVGRVVFPVDNVQSGSDLWQFTEADLTEATQPYYANPNPETFVATTPVVVANAPPIAVGSTVDYRVGGSPMGGTVKSVRSRGNEQLLMVELEPDAVYIGAPSEPETLIDAGYAPEFPIWRLAPENMDEAEPAVATQKRLSASARTKADVKGKTGAFEWKCEAGKGGRIQMDFIPVWYLAQRNIGMYFTPKVSGSGECEIKAVATKGIADLMLLMPNPGATALVYFFGKNAFPKPYAAIKAKWEAKTTTQLAPAGGVKESGAMAGFTTKSGPSFNLLLPSNLTGGTLLSAPAIGELTTSGEAGLVSEAKADDGNPDPANGGVVGKVLALLKRFKISADPVSLSAKGYGSLSVRATLVNPAQVYANPTEPASVKTSGKGGVSLEIKGIPKMPKWASNGGFKSGETKYGWETTITESSFKAGFRASAQPANALGSNVTSLVPSVTQYGYDGKTPLLDANGRPKTAAAPRWLSGATVGFAGPRNKNLSFFGRPVNTTVARRIAGSAQECSGRVVKTPVIAMIGPIAGRSNEVNVCGGRAVTATPGMGKGRVGGPPARVKVKGKVNPRASSKHSAQAFAKSGAAGEPFTIDHDLSGATTAGQTTVAGEDQLIDSDLMAQCVRKGVARGKATLRFNNPEPIDDNEREEPYEVDTFLLCDDPKTPDQPNDEGNRPRRLFGDPHIVLPNGQGYDFHATGDFTILQTADKSAVVHARFEPASSSAATATSRLAMKVGSDTVEIFKTGTGPEAPMAVKLNGEFLVSKALGVTPFSSTRGYGAEQITYALPGGGTLYADATWTGIAAPDKSYPLELTVIWPAPQGAAGSSPAARVANAVEVSVQANGWLDFMPVFTEEWSGRVAGLLGNGDSNSAGYAGLLMPNGSPLLASANEPLTFGRVYGVFGPAWAVDSRECLFSDGCVEAQMPTSPVILTAAQRATGEAACAAVAEGFFRQACIMDVGITGDVSLANSPVYAQQPAPPGSVPPPPAIALTLNVDTVQGQPNASKDQALTVRSVVPAGYALFLVQPMTAGASVTVNGQALLQPGDGLEGSLAPGVEASNMLRLTCGVQPGEGELGVAPIDPMTQTVQIENTLRVPLLCGQLAAGDAATTAVYGGSAFKIDAQGKLWAWGNNGEGQLGDGTTVHRGTPVRIQLGGDDVNAKSIVVHNGHTSNSYIAYAIDVNGGVWGWGNNPARFTDQYGNMKNMPVLWPTKINLPADVVVKNLISKTTSHNGSSYSPNPANTYAIDTMDRIWAWGSNYAGQLGNGTATPIQNQDPVQVQLPMDVKPISLVFGGGTSQTTAYVVDAGGDVWAWGYNGAGQYGYGMLGNESTVNNSPVPVKVSLPAGVNVQKVATDSDYHTAVIDTEGGLWSWGKHDGALGYHAAANAPSKKPIKVLFPETGVLIDNIQYARGAAFATDRNGAVWAWGNGCDDHCGINPASLVDGHKQITPAKLMFPAGVKIVEIQNQPNSVSYARDEAGRVWGWGGIDEGDNPTLVIASQPVQIALPPSVQISHMKQTHHTNLMIDAEGRVWGVYASWFSNGFRSVTAAPAFSALPLPAGVIAAKAISAGYPDSATIVDTQNRIWRWPINNFSIVAAQVVTP